LGGERGSLPQRGRVRVGVLYTRVRVVVLYTRVRVAVKLIPNRLQNTIQILEHLVVPKPDQTNAPGFEPSGSFGVFR
jgi:hypothetical protein